MGHVRALARGVVPSRARSVVFNTGSKWCQYGRIRWASEFPGQVKSMLMEVCVYGWFLGCWVRDARGGSRVVIARCCRQAF